MKIISIAGGTASGKTTIAEKITKIISSNDVKVELLSLDNYYLSGDEAQYKFGEDEIDWDDPITLNWEKLINDLKKLGNNEKIQVEKFDFNTNKHDGIIEITPPEILIIEGIFALNNSKINEIVGTKIYVHADADTRLIRRIERDRKLRYSTFDENEFMNTWIKHIKPSHDKYIAPSEKIADIIINTTNHMQKEVEETLGFLMNPKGKK